MKTDPMKTDDRPPMTPSFTTRHSGSSARSKVKRETDTGGFEVERGCCVITGSNMNATGMSNCRADAAVTMFTSTRQAMRR